LIAGLIATIWQARRAQAQQAKAERRFNDVRKLANSLFEIHDAIAELQGTTQARALVVKRALEYLDSLAQEASDDRGLQQELAAAYVKVGDVQGRPGHGSLGDKEGALTSYRKALAIYEALAASGSINDGLRQEMTTGFTRVGDALQSRDSTAALASYRQGLAMANPTDRLSIANFHQRIAEMQIATGDAGTAAVSQQQAMALFETMAAETPNDQKAQRSLFINYIKAGNLLFEAGEAKAALPLYQKTVPMARALAEADPLNARAQRELAACLDKVGNALFAANDQNGALTQYNEAFAIRQKVAAADTRNAELQRDLSISHDKLGEVSTAQGNIAAALAHYREALRIDTALASRDTQSLLDRANSLEKIGALLLQSGDVNGALEHQQKGRVLREDVVNNLDKENVQARRDLASSYLRLGEASLKKAGQSRQATDWQQARQWLQRSLDEWQSLKQRGALSKKDDGEWDKIAREIAKCDAALRN
jgi:non-specific serine/threonine protein kinase/serine/threonine-protein kinase